LSFKRRDATVNGLDLHDHSGLTAKGIVVNFAMFVCGVIAEIVHNNFSQTFVASAFEY
jgi:hypothetical protein